jgi:hypothetical protein
MNTLIEQSVTPVSHSTTEIPYGCCHCGCGGKTFIPYRNHKQAGWIKGVPLRYLRGHNPQNCKFPLAPRGDSLRIVVDGVECRTIPLTCGLSAIVDSSDYDELNSWNWHSSRCGVKVYAKRNNPGGTSGITMHQQLVATTEGHEVDHINGNGLDNRRCNLRPVTRSQNNQNRQPRRNASSRFKGVSWDRKHRFWEASIGNNGKIRLGYFASEEEAAMAYDAKAKELFGEFARLNFG